MSASRTVEELQQLGFDWPRYDEIEESAVVTDRKIDLDATLESLQGQKRMWDKQYAEAKESIRMGRFKVVRSADEITDADIYAGNCQRATDYVQEIIKGLPS